MNVEQLECRPTSNQIDTPLTAPCARTNAATSEVSSSPARHGGHELLEATREVLWPSSFKLQYFSIDRPIPFTCKVPITCNRVKGELSFLVVPRVVLSASAIMNGSERKMLIESSTLNIM
jgi:hypothetical protein